jgi:GNAT superfamily N-acetyltransferase
MKRDDERREFKRLEDQLGALDEDIETARRDLERVITVHFDEYFGGKRLRKPPAGPIPGERVELRDGSAVVVRPVDPADSSLVKEGFEHLSAVSRYRRFLFDRPDLTASEAEAEELTRRDDRDHEALLAVDPETGDGAGLARYVRDPRDSTRAVAAVWVMDAWQGRGLATELMRRLAQRALAAGIEHFEGHMIVGDTSAQRMFESVGSLETTQRAAGTLDVTVRLSA